MVKCVTMTSTGIAMESDLVGMTYQRVGVDSGLALTCPRAKLCIGRWLCNFGCRGILKELTHPWFSALLGAASWSLTLTYYFGPACRAQSRLRYPTRRQRSLAQRQVP